MAIAKEKLPQGQSPLPAGGAEQQLGIQHQQQRQRVTDRRSVGNVARQGGEVADLPRGDLPRKLVQPGKICAYDAGVLQVRIGHVGADADALRRESYLLQPGQSAQIQQHRIFLALHVHLHHDVSTAVDDHPLRMLRLQAVQFLQRGGAQICPAMPARRICHSNVFRRGLEGKKLRLDSSAPVGNDLPGSVVFRQMPRGFQNALVSRAAAEIAFQRCQDLLFRRLGNRCQQGKQAHHESGRAVAALGGMMVQHCLLDGMQVVRSANALHRDQVLPVQFRRGIEAGIDRFVEDRAFKRPRHRDRASAAVALVAGAFGAVEPDVLLQEFQCGLRRGNVRCQRLPIEPKCNAVVVVSFCRCYTWQIGRVSFHRTACVNLTFLS